MAYYALLSVLRQCLRPDLVVLNISEDDLRTDSQVKCWTESLPDNERVKVRCVPDMGSYRKLLPTLELADEDDIIVTADDDVIYSQIWLERLIARASEAPKSIVCCRARRIRRNIFGMWTNYANWELIREEQFGIDILPTGGAGAVYRKRLLKLDFLTDPKFMEIAPTSDDLWFRMASLLKSVPVLVDPSIDASSIYLRHTLGLEQRNLRGGVLDRVPEGFGRRYVGRIVNYLGIDQTPNDRAWTKICDYARSYGWNGFTRFNEG